MDMARLLKEQQKISAKRDYVGMQSEALREVGDMMKAPDPMTQAAGKLTLGKLKKTWSLNYQEHQVQREINRLNLADQPREVAKDRQIRSNPPTSFASHGMPEAPKSPILLKSGVIAEDIDMAIAMTKK